MLINCGNVTELLLQFYRRKMYYTLYLINKKVSSFSRIFYWYSYHDNNNVNMNCSELLCTLLGMSIIKTQGDNGTWVPAWVNPWVSSVAQIIRIKSDNQSYKSRSLKLRSKTTRIRQPSYATMCKMLVQERFCSDKINTTRQTTSIVSK